MIQILLAEDDKSLNKIVSTYLTNQGYTVFGCFDGEEALAILDQENIDLVLSDIMMPVMDGYQLAQHIRASNKQIPIFFMTAKEDLNSKQKGYDLDIDDYIVKPFVLDELNMRISALLRRANIISSKKLVVGKLTMDYEEHMAYYDGKSFVLTVREFDILFKLLSYPKRTFTRSQLMELFWDFDTSATSRTVDVYMAKLRNKTSECSEFEIVTVHGLGYKAVLK